MQALTVLAMAVTVDVGHAVYPALPGMLMPPRIRPSFHHGFPMDHDDDGLIYMNI